MTVSKRETERKYEPSSSGIEGLPDLTGAGPVASVTAAGPEELDAVYHDTADLRLAGSSATLRRRTGGPDAGWHLKLPLTGDTRRRCGPRCRTRCRTRCANCSSPAPGEPRCVR